MPDTNNPVGLRPHDHAGCVDSAMKRAEKLAEASSVNMTPTRKRTLEILLESHKALGAYEISQRLGSEGLGRQPVVAYRALDFLMEHDFVHKIEGLNAFVACAHSGEHHTPTFMVCDSCHKVAEAPAASTQATLGNAAKDVGFKVERTIIELHGQCAECDE